MTYSVETFSSTVEVGGLRLEFDIQTGTPEASVQTVAYLSDGKTVSGAEFTLTRAQVSNFLHAFNDLYHVMGS